MEDTFFFTAGSMVGREHVRVFRNNQDAVALSAEDELLIAAVADGCSSGRYSEVGARLAVSWLTRHLPSHLARHRDNDRLLLRDLEFEMLAYLGRCLRPLAGPDDLADIVADFALFTLLVLVVDKRRTRIFGLGDGVFAINDELKIIDAGERNAPPYIGYRMLQAARVDGPRKHLRMLATRPTRDVHAAMIATDGLVDVQTDEFLDAPGVMRNRRSVQRRLVVLGANERRLRDDTTVALLRRRSPCGL